MRVVITPNDRGNPPGKLADAELHFGDGDPLPGLKLIGFGIWERRGAPGVAANVTFPARQYAVNGERRSFALLRPIVDGARSDALRDLILAAYADYQARDQAPAVSEPPAAPTRPPFDAVSATFATDAAARAADAPDQAPAPAVDVDDLPARAARYARELWNTFTASERAGVRVGMFPAEKMRAADAAGFADRRASHALVCALMDCASGASASAPAAPPVTTSAPAAPPAARLAAPSTSTRTIANW